MHRSSWKRVAALVLSVIVVTACHPEFQLKNFTSNESLYAASLSAFQHHKWDDAVTGFEKLTTDLPPRDTLLPRSYWYLASAHEHLGEHLLAAQSFSRLVESFPEDSLADDAGLEASRSYAKLWRRPQLDPLYGEQAISSYNTLIGLYPNSPLIPTAQKEIAELENKLAIKNYEAGLYYFGHKWYDSGIIYFKDVLARFGTTPTARLASIKLVQSYKAIHYMDDAADQCAQLRQQYPSDREATEACAGVAVVAAKADSAAAPRGGKPPVP